MHFKLKFWRQEVPIIIMKSLKLSTLMKEKKCQKRKNAYIFKLIWLISAKYTKQGTRQYFNNWKYTFNQLLKYMASNILSESKLLYSRYLYYLRNAENSNLTITNVSIISWKLLAQSASSMDYTSEARLCREIYRAHLFLHDHMKAWVSINGEWLDPITVKMVWSRKIS